MLLWLDFRCCGYFLVHEYSLSLSVDHLESMQGFRGVLEVEGAEQTMAFELLPAPLGFSRFLVGPNPAGALQPKDRPQHWGEAAFKPAARDRALFEAEGKYCTSEVWQ